MTHSSYWLDDDIFDPAPRYSVGTIAQPADNNLAKIVRLAAIRRAVGNFVSILAGKNIPVDFSSGRQSYTDGERVVISADENPDHFDSMVGLALHEGSHVLLTDFRWLRGPVKQFREVIENNVLPLEPAHFWYWYPAAPTYTLEQWLDLMVKGFFPENIRAALNIQLQSTGATNGGRSSFDDILKSKYNISNQSNSSSYYMQMDDAAQRRLLRALTDVQMLMNILEDRRIDKFVYTTAGGYRPYYQALYNRYFYTAEIGKNLRFNPAWRELTVENYLNRLLFSFHPAADPEAMPGLPNLLRMLDLPNIDRVAPAHDPVLEHMEHNKPAWMRTALKNDSWLFNYEDTPILWREACAIYGEILKYVDLADEALQASASAEDEDGAIGEGIEGGARPGTLPNLDGGVITMVPRPVEKDQKGRGKNVREVEGKYNEAKAQREVDTAKRVMTGEVKRKKLKTREIDAVNALDEANAKIVDLKGDGIPGGQCMVLRKVTPTVLGQDWFIFRSSSWYADDIEQAIAAGKRMGQLLLHRLQVRNDPMVTKQTRLPQGGLDRRLLAQLGMDITSVFHKSRVDQHRPAMLHLTLDASGSMSGDKWWKVLSVSVALAYLGSKMRNVDVVISIRGGDNIPIVAIVFDSRKDQFVNFIKIARKIGPSGGTPEGLCYKATMELILENTVTHDVYFINFSDGEPAFTVYDNLGTGPGRRAGMIKAYYAGDLATTHTRKQIQTMKDAGVKVLSYFITGNHENYGREVSQRNFKRMYGEDAEFCNVSNATEVLRTLNRLLVKRGT